MLSDREDDGRPALGRFYRRCRKRATSQLAVGALQALGRDQNLAVPLWVRQVVEPLTDAVQADLAGDQRADIYLALGQDAQLLGEFVRRLGECELDVDLFSDPEE